MAKTSIMATVSRLKGLVFTTFELVSLSGKTDSAVTQGLNHLSKTGVVKKIYRGVWTLAGRDISPFAVMPYLFPRQRAYVSFISALNLHGMVEQIPQVITVASLSFPRTIRTGVGTFEVHRIAPAFFFGFSWYKDEGSFLIAQPEKALLDSLYLSIRPKHQYSHFPELSFPENFDVKKATAWAEKIPNIHARVYVLKKLRDLFAKT